MRSFPRDLSDHGQEPSKHNLTRFTLPSLAVVALLLVASKIQPEQASSPEASHYFAYTPTELHDQMFSFLDSAGIDPRISTPIARQLQKDAKYTSTSNAVANLQAQINYISGDSLSYPLVEDGKLGGTTLSATLFVADTKPNEFLGQYARTIATEADLPRYSSRIRQR